MNVLIDGQVLSTPEINRGIGVYFKNVLENMVKSNAAVNWYITLDNKTCINALDSWLANRLIGIVNPDFAPGFDYNRSDKYTNLLNEAIKKYNIDIFWSPNPLMVNVLFPSKNINCKFLVTIHDLIPYYMPVADWPENVRKEYHRRLDYIMNKKVNALCDSEYTKEDLVRVVGEGVATKVVLLAADNRLFSGASVRDDKEPYILFTGGFDYRKNINGAVKAYELALEKYKDSPLFNSKFYLVCKCGEEEKEKFYKELSDEVAKRVILTGFVTDEGLVELYKGATLFFFPSLYEGFGLPIVEAMLAGAPVLSADNSSLPEVCGDYGDMCDANNIEEMADCIYKSFMKSLEETKEDRQKRQQYAYNRFSWEKCAKETFDFFKDLTRPIQNKRKYKIALVTPWPQQKSGIANYVYKMIPYLSRYFDVDIFADNAMDKDAELTNNKYGKLYTIDELSAHREEYDEIVYHIGNNEMYHKESMKCLMQYGGIAEIHDFDLSPFFYFSFYYKKNEEDRKIILDALKRGYGKEGEKYYRTLKAGDAGIYKMTEAVATYVDAAIFHNSWSYNECKTDKRKYLVPHPCFDNSPAEDSLHEAARERIIEKINYQGDEIIIGVLGIVNKNKRYDIVLSAVKKLVEEGKNVKLVFWGGDNYNVVEAEIEKSGLKGKAFLMGYLDRVDYEVGILMSDVIVNLRYPSVGESSGTLCEAMKNEKAVIVSALNQYLEFPDEVCWKLPVSVKKPEKEIFTLFQMLEVLIDNKEVRDTLARNAKKYSDQVLSPEKIAENYYDCLAGIIRGEAK